MQLFRYKKEGDGINTSGKNRIQFNILIGLVTFAVSLCISFFITPIVVERLGSEAHGFVTLANNFVSYASLITVALNSMESRFVSVEIYKGNYERANQYFTSVFFANIVIAVILIPIMGAFIVFMDSIIEVPAFLLSDVRTTFAIVFLQFVIEILTSRFEIATFVTNRLNLYYINNVVSTLIRLAVILVGFHLFSVNIIFLVLGSLIGKLFVVSRNIHYTRSFLPGLQVQKKYFSFARIIEVVSAGVWNLVSKLSGVLLEGLDLLIANIFIGAAEMGALSISKTIPALFMTLRGTLDYPFSPPMTECYAKGDIDGVVRYARRGNKVLGILMIAPMSIFLVFGESFFSLWVPSQDARLLEILSLLSIMSLLAGSCINSVFTVFTITNHVKVNSLVILGTGVATTGTVFFLLNTTNLGVYAIAGVSSFFGLARNFIFTPLYGAYCLGVKKSTFYHEILTGNLCLLINAGVAFGISKLIPASSWIGLVAACGVSAVICIFINVFIVLSKQERIDYLDMARQKMASLRNQRLR